MLRLDDPLQTTLQQLINQFGASKAEVIRQLIADAEPEDFPPSWHMRAVERRAQQAQAKGMGKGRTSRRGSTVGEEGSPDTCPVHES